VFPTQSHRDLTEQFEGGFEVFDDLLGKDVRIGKIVGFVRVIVSETEDVDVSLARLMRTSPLISPSSANPRSLRAFLPRLFRNESTTLSG
jgi:hypothetical protein